ncbi:hypothetical protein pipiens_009744 [Culex pipiens pipiens]|uniref:Uncharacterized protein n=1 Tax=Culex pipiens pipiens TaxID=38569 RepID=A0ABD1DCR2_CULPP
MATMTALPSSIRTLCLLDVLRESTVQSDKFQLPEGSLNIKKGTDTELDPISGDLNPWGSFTQVLAELTNKWPQFIGMEQYDKHELLQHLLESVRREDLIRYQLAIVLSLGYGKRPKTVEDRMEKYQVLRHASDRMLDPEPVFPEVAPAILAINVASFKPNSSLQGGPRHLSANSTTRATNAEFASAKGGYSCFPTGQARDGSCTQASPRPLSTPGAIPVPGSAGKSSATIGRRVATRAQPGATSSTTANVWVKNGNDCTVVSDIGHGIRPSRLPDSCNFAIEFLMALETQTSWFF